MTENITVYRKRTSRLIDWNIRHHPDPEAAKASRIRDGYERTNIWRISPSSHPVHPCVFPDALAERVVRYYSFVGDLVLDPFAGTGTVGRVAGFLKRRFLLIEKSETYSMHSALTLGLRDGIQSSIGTTTSRGTL